ncbi:MAG: hypothetical protein AAGJ82_14520, partial [Bacteroidota bacterium]
MRLFLMSSYLLAGFALLGQQPLSCDDTFTTVGSTVQEDDCFRMTSTAASQTGCLWFDELVDFSGPLSHTVTMSFGTNDGGADGICLVYQNSGNSACGGSGESIAAAGIANSFIIEFDTWQNGNLSDPFNDHASISQNGVLDDFIESPLDLGNIEDGNSYEVTFNWNPATNNYEVIFAGATIFNGNYDIVNNCFGGNSLVYWGFTSSTGGQTNTQYVCPGLPEPPEAMAEANITQLPCEGAVVTLDGSGSDSGFDIVYQWDTDDGSIISGDDTTMPEISGPGTYTLT